MIKRIELIIQSQNLTPSQFADRIGIQRSGLSHILSGRNNPSLDFVQKVLTAFSDLNPAWLLQGKGRMYVNLSEVKEVAKEEPAEADFKPETSEETLDFEQTEIEEEDAEMPLVEMEERFENKPKLRRILLFYEDGTFEEYSPR